MLPPPLPDRSLFEDHGATTATLEILAVRRTRRLDRSGRAGGSHDA
jgi:hypothetical protein